MTKPRMVNLKSAAFRLAVGPCLFAEGDAATGRHPITGLARSAQPVFDPDWGEIYHDFEGMKLDGERVPLDYCHCEGEIVGFADSFTADEEGLHIGGELTPFREDDRASEIIAKSRGGQGVPYQLSIDFRGDDVTAEEVPEGATSEVNGQTVSGPALIFRQWPLRGVAVCPYGKDRNTSAQFSNQDGEGLTVRILSEGTMPKTMKKKPAAVRQMTASKKPAKTVASKKPVGRQMSDDDKKPEEQQEEEQQEEDDEDPAVEDGEQDDTSDDAAADDGEEEALEEDEEQQQEEDKPKPQQQQSERNQLAKFVKAFGEAQGAKYFLAGKTFSQATALENERLRKALKDKDRQLTVSRRRLEQLGEDGEAEPLSLTGDDGDDSEPAAPTRPPGGQYSATIGSKLGLLAESIKLPSRN